MSQPYHDIGWSHDLPSPGTPPIISNDLAELKIPPASVTPEHLELDRSNLNYRGGSILLGVFIVIMEIDLISSLALLYYNSPHEINTNITIATLAFILSMIFLIGPYIRMDLEQPCNEPMRFNRYRRKVYVYRYKFDRLHPFSKEGWGVHPVAYDWDDLVAEVYKVYVPLGYGGAKESVKIAVRKPGTEEVIDRFVLSDNIHEGTQYWNLIRLFMQQGPDALPFFKYQPLDWDHERSLTPFRKRAPKVQWPAEMDLESRTAPGAPQ